MFSYTVLYPSYFEQPHMKSQQMISNCALVPIFILDRDMLQHSADSIKLCI